MFLYLKMKFVKKLDHRCVLSIIVYTYYLSLELLLPDVWSVVMNSCYVGMMLRNVYVIVLWHVALYQGVCILILYVNLSLRIMYGNFLGLHFSQWLMPVCRCCWLEAQLVHRPPNQHLQQAQSITKYTSHTTYERKTRRNKCATTEWYLHKRTHNTKHWTPVEL
jgi:hypothetical protein